MADPIDRQIAIKAISKFCEEECDSTYCGECRVKYPDTVIKHADDKDIISILEELPPVQPERKKGEWIEKLIVNNSDIEEWQSAKCSVCGKYHTTPYLYNFDNFNYCPMCGADMRGEKDGSY